MHGGPDGKGWNRLSVLGGSWRATPRCVLQPLTVTAWWESLHRRTSAIFSGLYGDCVKPPSDPYGQQPDCTSCPVATRHTTLSAFEPRVLIRYFCDGYLVAHHTGHAYLMNKPDDPDSSARVWTWTDLLALDGWAYDGRHLDDGISPGHWIRAIRPPERGVYR
jgi:hypothetical protein